MTYELKIISINCNTSENGLTDVVKSINWEYIGTEGEHTIKESGLQEVPLPNPTTFIATTSLTKEVVTGWLTDIFNEEKPAGPMMLAKGFTVMTKFSQMQNIFLKRLERKLNPPVPETKILSFDTLL